MSEDAGEAAPAQIRVRRGEVESDAALAWRYEGGAWIVTLTMDAGAQTFEASADDAFEALCRVREQAEPDGWRVGVAGARPDVWPSGMARDQGGGLTAYRLGVEAEAEADAVVDTFAPVDPTTTSTVAAQQAVAERAGLGRPSA